MVVSTVHFATIPALYERGMLLWRVVGRQLREGTIVSELVKFRLFPKVLKT